MSEDIQCLIDKAYQGDVDAMVNVAECYNHGWYVEKDDVKANKYYKMAAEKGHAEAAFMLGLGYLSGVGAKEDMCQAVKWVRYAADKGVANAQYIIGMLHSDDEAREYLKGNKRYYFEQAAKQGHAKAQIELGDLYLIGDGVEQDLNKGLFWLVCAYIQGDSPEESAAAKDRIDALVRTGMPGGKARVERVMAEVSKNYPQYVSGSKARNDSVSLNTVTNANDNIGILGIAGIDDSIKGLLFLVGIIGIIVIAGILLTLR